MLDPGVNQDVCQGQSLTITWFTGSEPAVSHDAVHLLRFVKVQDGEFDASVGGWVYVFSVTLDRPSAVNMAIPIRLDHLSPSPGLIEASLRLLRNRSSVGCPLWSMSARV